MDVRSEEPSLPQGRGPLSDALVECLRGGGPPPDAWEVAGADPFGEDLQLALYLCYELHYRGFAGVADDREWDPELLRFRASLEWPFLEALRAVAPRHKRADEALDDLLVEPVNNTDGTGVSRFLAEEGELWQLREYAAQRSLYHLKEADPHAWVLPRLWGRAKAGMAAVEFDEFG
ncbi:iron-containing redox enzyme family protein, partial [Streptomyces neyagawaensis]